MRRWQQESDVGRATFLGKGCVLDRSARIWRLCGIFALHVLRGRPVVQTRGLFQSFPDNKPRNHPTTTTHRTRIMSVQGESSAGRKVESPGTLRRDDVKH